MSDGGAHDPPGVADREVVLAEMNAVAARQPGQVGPVVHDQGYAGLGRQNAHLAGSHEQLAVGKALFAILDDVGTAGQGLADDPGQIAQVGRPPTRTISLASPRPRWAATAVIVNFSSV